MSVSILLRLIRHPKPDIDLGICYGRTNVPADAADLARLVGVHAQTQTPGLVYSSPLSRCHDFAKAMALRGWPTPLVDERIAEMNFGQWEGQRWDEIEATELAQWRANIADHVPPGGESVRAIAQRALSFAHDVRQRHGRRGHELEAQPLVIAVFTHAGIIQTLPRIWRGEVLGGFAGTRVDYGSVTELHLESM